MQNRKENCHQVTREPTRSTDISGHFLKLQNAIIQIGIVPQSSWLWPPIASQPGVPKNVHCCMLLLYQEEMKRNKITLEFLCYLFARMAFRLSLPCIQLLNLIKGEFCQPVFAYYCCMLLNTVCYSPKETSSSPGWDNSCVSTSYHLRFFYVRDANIVSKRS